MNKLRAFLLRPFVTDIVGVTKSSLDMSAVLNGGLLLVRIPKGVVGDETARLLGSFVVAQVWQAATARANVAGVNRRVVSNNCVDIPVREDGPARLLSSFEINFELLAELQMTTRTARRGVWANLLQCVMEECVPRIGCGMVHWHS